jgi:NAD(P)-dependent dehydrogenase (short-subunit alcohol dehydrogenase family)
MTDARMFDLSGQVAVVTGGTSGIGRGIAAGLAGAGAAVAIWGRDEARGQTAQEELSRDGARVVAVACDVRDPASVDAAFDQTLDELGRVDACFANAGGADLGPSFVDMTLDDFRAVVSVNLEGAFLTFQGAARHMIERGGGGSLVGISSLAAVEGMARGQHYAASKAGLIAMTRSLAVELARHGIRANAILPGWIETPATERQFAAIGDRVLARIPERRWGVPADFAGAAVYLASGASAYHTGDELVIDGGYRVF